jgi:hypothetical protein
MPVGRLISMLASDLTSHGATLSDAKSSLGLVFGVVPTDPADLASFADAFCCFALMREIDEAATGSGWTTSASEAELTSSVGDSLLLFLAPDCASRISWSDAPESL